MRQTAKRRFPSLLITLILAALLNLLIFAAMRPWKLQESYRLAFWFSYGALMLAFVLRSLSLSVGGGDASDRRVHTGLPLAFSALVYWGVTLILSFLYMILSVCRVRVPFALPLITLVFVLGFYIIAMICHFATRPTSHIAPADSPMRRVADRLYTLKAQVSDAISARHLGELADRIAVSHAEPGLAERLTSCLAELEERIAANDRLGIEQMIATMKTFLTD